jgi:hypothetical protein
MILPTAQRILPLTTAASLLDHCMLCLDGHQLHHEIRGCLGRQCRQKKDEALQGYWASALKYSGRLEVYVAKFTATEKIMLKGRVLIGYYWYARRPCARVLRCIRESARSVVQKKRSSPLTFHSYLPRHRVTKLYPDPSPKQHTNPQPLCFREPIIL